LLSLTLPLVSANKDLYIGDRLRTKRRRCRFEIEHLGKKTWKGDEALRKAISRRGKVTHYVTVCTTTVRDTKPRVDVYITLIGQLTCTQIAVYTSLWNVVPNSTSRKKIGHVH